jgi:hypothetical protein
MIKKSNQKLHPKLTVYQVPPDHQTLKGYAHLNNFLVDTVVVTWYNFPILEGVSHTSYSLAVIELATDLTFQFLEVWAQLTCDMQES